MTIRLYRFTQLGAWHRYRECINRQPLWIATPLEAIESEEFRICQACQDRFIAEQRKAS